MAAQDHLGPQFYHGTPAVLNPGQLIHPASQGHAQAHGGSADHAHMTRDSYQAGVYATRAGRSAGHVYQVEPTGPSEPDPAHTMADESGPLHMRSSGPLRVVRHVETIVPGRDDGDPDFDVY